MRPPLDPPGRPRSPVTVCRAIARRTASSPPSVRWKESPGTSATGRWRAQSRASARMRAAGTPHTPAAHSGVAGVPRGGPAAGPAAPVARRPRRRRRRRARARGGAARRSPSRARRRRARRRRPRLMSSCSSASMRALSVPGSTGSHSVPSSLAVVVRRGSMTTTGTPRRLRLAHSRPPLAPHDAVHQVGAPEHDHRRVTERRRVDAGVLRAQHHRLGEAGGGRTVRGRLLHVPAAEVEVAGGEVLGVVQRAAARAGPAQRQDRGVAVPLAHARETLGDEPDRLVPAGLAEAARAPRAGAHQRARQAVLGLLLPPRLEPAHAALEIRPAGRVVGDAHHTAALHGREQRAAAAAITVAGDRRVVACDRHEPSSSVPFARSSSSA